MTELPDSNFSDNPSQPVALTKGWRWLRLGLVALGVWWALVLLGWTVLHALILPRINDYRGWLQQTVTQRLGVTVQIDELQVQGNWLVPWLQARDVLLKDARGREALRLPRVVVAFSDRKSTRLNSSHT